MFSPKVELRQKRKWLTEAREKEIAYAIRPGLIAEVPSFHRKWIMPR